MVTFVIALRFLSLVILAARALAQTSSATEEPVTYPMADFPEVPPWGGSIQGGPPETTPRSQPIVSAPDSSVTAADVPTPIPTDVSTTSASKTTAEQTTSTTPRPTTTTSYVVPESTISSNFEPNQPFVESTGNDRIALSETTPASDPDATIKETTQAHVLTDGGPPPGQTVSVTETTSAKSPPGTSTVTKAVTEATSQKDIQPFTPQTMTSQSQTNNTLDNPSSADSGFITEQMYETTDVASVLEETTKPSIPTTTTVSSTPAVTPVPKVTPDLQDVAIGPSYEIINSSPVSVADSVIGTINSIGTEGSDIGFNLPPPPPPPPSDFTDPIYDSEFNHHPESGRGIISKNLPPPPPPPTSDFTNPIYDSEFSGRGSISASPPYKSNPGYEITNDNGRHHKDHPNLFENPPPVIPIKDTPLDGDILYTKQISPVVTNTAVRQQTSYSIQALYDENSKFVANLNPFSAVSQNTDQFNWNSIFSKNYVPGQPLWRDKDSVQFNRQIPKMDSSRTNSQLLRSSSQNLPPRIPTTTTTKSPVKKNTINHVSATYNLWNALIKYHLGSQQNSPSSNKIPLTQGDPQVIKSQGVYNVPSQQNAFKMNLNNGEIKQKSNPPPPFLNSAPPPINVLASKTNPGAIGSQRIPPAPSLNLRPTPSNTLASKTDNVGFGAQSNLTPSSFNSIPPPMNPLTLNSNNGAMGSPNDLPPPPPLKSLPPLKENSNINDGGIGSLDNQLPNSVNPPPPPPPPPPAPVVISDASVPVSTQASMRGETASTYRRIFRTLVPITADPNIVKSTEPQLNMNIPTLAYEDPAKLAILEANIIADSVESVKGFPGTDANSNPFSESGLSNPAPPPVVLDVTTSRPSFNENVKLPPIIIPSITTTKPITRTEASISSKVDTTTELSIEQKIAILEKTQNNTVVKQHLPPEVCQCDFELDRCYMSETVCNRFVECVIVGNKVQAREIECALGTFWNPKISSCTKPTYVDCPSDPCKTGVDRHPFHGKCRAYWQCLRGRSSINCCAPGYRYNNINGGPVCVPDKTCNEKCIEEEETVKGPPSVKNCFLKAIEGSPTQYQVDSINRTCAGGTIFDQVQCTCVSGGEISRKNNVCKPEVVIDFEGNKDTAFRDKSGKTSSIGDKRVVLNGEGSALFYGSGLISMPRFSNAEFGSKFAVYIRFNPYGRSKLSMALISNCLKNRKDASVDIRLNTWKSEISYTISTSEKSDVTLIGRYKPFRFNEAILIYSGNTFLAETNDIGNSTTVEGRILPRRPGLKLGGCNREDGYLGYIDDVRIYSNCLPPEYVDKLFDYK